MTPEERVDVRQIPNSGVYQLKVWLSGDWRLVSEHPKHEAEKRREQWVAVLTAAVSEAVEKRDREWRDGKVEGMPEQIRLAKLEQRALDKPYVDSRVDGATRRARADALEQAAKALCRWCRDGYATKGYGGEYGLGNRQTMHYDSGGNVGFCKATKIRALAAKGEKGEA